MWWKKAELKDRKMSNQLGSGGVLKTRGGHMLKTWG